MRFSYQDFLGFNTRVLIGPIPLNILDKGYRLTAISLSFNTSDNRIATVSLNENAYISMIGYCQVESPVLLLSFDKQVGQGGNQPRNIGDQDQHR